MLSPQALVRGIVQRALSSINQDSQSNDVALRLASYGEIYNQPLVRKAHNLADEGTYFTTNNAQSGVAMTAGNVFAAANPFIVITNGNPAGSGINTYIDYINLLATAAGGAASTLAYVAAALVIDNIPRYSSAGSILPGFSNVNINSARSSKTTAYAGAITANTASGAAKTISGLRNVRPAVSASVACVVGDNINFNFGAVEGAVGSNIVVANPSIIPVPMPPIQLPPQASALLYLWLQGATTPSAASFAPEIGIWER